MRKTLLGAALVACVASPLTLRARAPEPEPRSPDVVYVPTPEAVVDVMLELADVEADDVVYDLGCGDGRIVVTAARRFGARGVGVDVDPERIADSRRNVREARVGDRVQIVQRDLFTMNLRPASVITLYLLPSLNVKLRPQLLDQVKPGTRVVSHDFDMGEWKPDRTVTVGGHTVYFWVVPAEVGGRWRLGQAGDELLLDQEYQTARGSLILDGELHDVTDVRIDGHRLTLVVDGAKPREIVGRVDGETLRLDDDGRRLIGERVHASDGFGMKRAPVEPEAVR